MDFASLYRDMFRARSFERALAALWEEGWISGEMHLGTGEEAVAAGVCAHLDPDDALALDHRPTPFLLLRGVDPVAMLRECLGRTDGLCGGWGGHMHLFDPDRLSASSGIVGSSAPMAAGFALAAAHLRPRSVAVATFGEGAVNQGMVMESFNLAVAWTLPLVFVCKDNRWAVTTESATVTAGDIAARAASFGLPVAQVDGLDVEAVFEAAGAAVQRARRGEGPSFLLCRTARIDGHMLGDKMLRLAKSPVGEGRATFGKAIRQAMSRKGGSVVARAASLADMTGRLQKVKRDRVGGKRDPLVLARKALSARGGAVEAIEEEVRREMEAIVAQARGEAA